MQILPGNVSERIVELRNQRKLTQQELSNELEKRKLGFFDRATISRAESGKTTRINVELVEALSKFYGVTADYILGMTDIPDQKNYEISELGLSYEAARKLLRREVNPDALNRLLSCESAAAFCEMISAYFPADAIKAYTEMGRLFPEIKNISRHAEMAGFQLSEADQKKVDAHMAILREPEQLQKDALMKQFELIIEELIEGMYAGKDDPEPLHLHHQELMLELIKELKRKKRSARIAAITPMDRAEAIAHIAAKQMKLYEEEEELLVRLFLSMIRNHV